jgi:hypothetical protein
MSVLDLLGGLADLTGCVVLRLGLLVDIASPLFCGGKELSAMARLLIDRSIQA